MQIWSLSHHYSFRYIIYEAGFEEQGKTFNYTSPESPTNHFFRQPPYMVTSKFELENGSHVMQIRSPSHRYSCRYIVYDAGFEEQCQTFNYTPPESPTNHFSVNLNKWSRPNLNKKMVVTSCKYGLLSHHHSCRYIVYDAAFEEQCQISN